MSEPISHIYEFGPFRLDANRKLLLRDGEPVSLTPKALDTLIVLVERRDRVVGKDDLMAALWPDTTVEEHNLTVNISALRKALGEQPNQHRYIVTAPGRGYRFVAEAHESRSPKDSAVLTQSSGASVLIEPEDIEQEDAPVRAASPSRFNARRRILVVSALLVALAGAYIWFARKPNSTSEPIRSIAVLPFRSLGGEPEDEYLGLGITEVLLTRLGRASQLTVRPLRSARSLEVIERDPVALGAKLQVEAVLEGTIRREGERVRVVAHLVSVRDGSELWAGKFDERLTGILALEDAITERLADALILRLTGAERDLLTKRYTENVEAYQLYLKGRYYSKKHTPEGFKKSVELFERAIRLDQRYALAFAGLAESYHIASETLLPPREAMPKVREMAERALALDPALAEAHLSLGLARAWYDWDFAGAESAFQRSLELNPNFAEAHHYYGVFLALLGQCDQALAELNQAQRLDPLSPNINADFVFPLTCKRQYAPAVARLREAIEIEPNFWVPHFMLGVLLSHQGQWPEARAALNRAGSLSDSPQILAELGRIAALNGDKAQAREALNRLQALSARRYVSPYVMARVYLGLDEKDQALAWLERTYEHRSWWMTFLKFEPGLDGLRSDARFADLLRRVGLSPTL